MRKIFSKRLLLISSLVATVSAGVLWACGGGDWDEYGVSAYTPEAFVDSAYKPFFYSDMFYYEMGHDINHVYRFNDEVVADWKAYLKRPAADTELRFFLLTASLGLVDSVIANAAKSLPGNVGNMYLVKEKSSKKVASFFRFLHYAKANENYAAPFHYYWDYQEVTAPLKLDEEQLKNRAAMEIEMKKTKDNFIAQRYFFQVVRAYFFDGEFAQCISFYETNKSRFPENALAVRALSYVAGAYYKQKNYAQANYLFSRVYDAGVKFKTLAHYNFHPQEESDWQQTLAMSKSVDEKVTLWHLLGIYFDEEKAIREIYTLQPKSDKLDLLLARLINKQEIESNTESTEYGGGNYSPGKDSLSKNALRLVSEIADAGNTSKPYMWQLSAGYLHFINQDFNKAAAYYQKAQQSMPTNELPQAQLRLLVLMNNIAGLNKMEKKNEDFLLKDLVWLESVSDGSIPHFRFANAYDWIKRRMAGLYSRQKDALRSELFVHADSFYTNPVRAANLKSFLLSKNLTAFEQYCKTIYPISARDIAEFQYIVLAYEDKIDAALKQADSATNGGELPGNPFNGNIKDCHDCDHAAPQKVKYTKIGLLQKMQEMKDNIAAGKDVYNNSLLLGNAFYNMTHYGNARFFYECAVIGSYHYAPDVIPNSFRKMLLNQRNAKNYYKKALTVAVTAEQKAKMTYLILKCDRNEWYNQQYENGSLNGWSEAGFPPLNFASLMPFESTKYYEDVIAECGFFRSYADSRKK